VLHMLIIEYMRNQIKLKKVIQEDVIGWNGRTKGYVISEPINTSRRHPFLVHSLSPKTKFLTLSRFTKWQKGSIHKILADLAFKELAQMAKQ
jgi:hypothetical protein